MIDGVYDDGVVWIREEVEPWKYSSQSLWAVAATTGGGNENQGTEASVKIRTNEGNGTMQE